MPDKRIDLGAGGLEVIRAIARVPQWPEWATPDLQLRLLREEWALRDDLAQYAYAYDAGDVDAVMAHFADDVVITNPRGRYVGSDVVRKNYRLLFELFPNMRLVWGNVAIRFLDSPDEAYRTSYVQEVLLSPSKSYGAVSTDIHRLKKIAARWKIVERCINVEVNYPITARLGPPAEATQKAS
jgi:ketosteroid isomerase-like protein